MDGVGSRDHMRGKVGAALLMGSWLRVRWAAMHRCIIPFMTLTCFAILEIILVKTVQEEDRKENTKSARNEDDTKVRAKKNEVKANISVIRQQSCMKS